MTSAFQSNYSAFFFSLCYRSLLRFYTLEELTAEFNSFVRELFEIEFDKENELATIPEKISKEERRSLNQLDDLKKTQVPRAVKRVTKKKPSKIDQLLVYQSSNRVRYINR